jgi:sec-independent protein translocase protein TatA
MANIRGWELIVILVIVLLLFGVGRISKIAGELGRGIREFREGLSKDEDLINDSEVTQEEDISK